VSSLSSGDRRRTAALVAALLIGAAAVGLVVGVLLGKANDGDTTAKVAAPTTSPSTTATPSPTVSTTPRAASEIEKGTTSDIGYFLHSRTADDGTHVTFDRVLLLLDKDARAYAKAHHMKPPHPGQPLLVNDNTLTRDLVLSPDVKVKGGQQLAGSPTLQSVPLQTLLDKVSTEGSHLLLDLTYDKLGYVITVTEHDLP
jgi:hypothetical protein